MISVSKIRLTDDMDNGAGVVNLDNVTKMIKDDGLEEIGNTAISLIGAGLPVYFQGDSGTGKTHLAKVLARLFARRINKGLKDGERKVQVRYVQLDPTMTKQALIGGYRMGDGAKMLVALGIFGQAMAFGDVVIVDEITHAKESLLTLLNSALDRDARMSVGDLTFQAHPNFRVILASNPANYAGNSTIPPSLNNRLFTIKVPYPSEEVEFRATEDIVRTYVDADKVIPSVIKVVSGIGRKIREDFKQLPISCRSMATAYVAITLNTKYWMNKQDGKELIQTPDTGEKGRLIYQLIHNPSKAPDSKTVSKDKQTVEAYDFIESFGRSPFNETIKRAFGFYSDVSGIGYKKKDMVEAFSKHAL